MEQEAMTSRLLHEISFIHAETYLFWGEAGKLDISPNTREYYQWLTEIPSFHFKGKDGHFTARREQKKEGEAYWYAYRKAGNRQFKKYLGRTNRLSTIRLEYIATQIQEEINQLPPQPKRERKKPVPKATLRNQIARLEKTVAEQKQRIQELEQELAAVKQHHAAKGHRQIIDNRTRE
jgi:hypothetical protein